MDRLARLEAIEETRNLKARHFRLIDTKQWELLGDLFTGYTDHTVVWSLDEQDWDGATNWGDNQEFSPSESFRRLARGEIPLGEGA